MRNPIHPSKNVTLTLITLLGSGLLPGLAHADQLTEIPPAPPAPLIIEDSWPDPLAPVAEEEWADPDEEVWAEEGDEEVSSTVVCGPAASVLVGLPGLIDIDIDFGSILVGCPPLIDIDAFVLGSPHCSLIGSAGIPAPVVIGCAFPPVVATIPVPSCSPVYSPVFPPFCSTGLGPVFVPDFDPFYDPGFVYGPTAYGPSTFGPTLVAGGDIGDHYGDEIEINQNVTNVSKTKNVFNDNDTFIDNSLTNNSVQNGRSDGRRGAQGESAPRAGNQRAAAKSNRTAKDHKGGRARKPAGEQQNSKRSPKKRSPARSGKSSKDGKARPAHRSAPARAKSKSAARKNGPAPRSKSKSKAKSPARPKAPRTHRKPAAQHKARSPARPKAPRTHRTPAAQRKAKSPARPKAPRTHRTPAAQHKAKSPATRKASNNAGRSSVKSPSSRKRSNTTAGLNQKNKKRKNRDH